MKYKLINNQTKEEHLCDKVTIDGFDYYVSDETPKDKDKVLHKNGTIGVLTTALAIAIVEGTNEGSYVDECKKVIACNNPNIDIPKITSKIDLTKLCYYDRRNPDFSVKEELFVFTSEQLNKYTTNIIKQALETAAEKAEIKERKVTYSSSSGSEYGYVQSINKQSITNTFEETFKKFEV